MNRPEILEAARACVCGEREQDYGTPENNFETIGLFGGVYLRAAHLEQRHRLQPGQLCGPCWICRLCRRNRCKGGALMPKHKKKLCDPNMCDHCTYIGEGDFICDLHGVGPEETVFVLEDWEPTGHYLQCLRGGQHL